MHVLSFIQKRYSVTVGLVLAIGRTGECSVNTPSRAKVLASQIGYSTFQVSLSLNLIRVSVINRRKIQNYLIIFLN